MPVSAKMKGKIVTVSRYIMEMERNIPDATGDFSNLLAELTLAGKMIHREVSKAGLLDVLGKTGDINIQGEEVMKLDVLADEIVFRALDHTGHLCVLASEEQDTVRTIPPNYPCGKYVLNYDPLDGSSNIDANVSIGTIFSIHERVSAGGAGRLEDLLQPGDRQVAAGYVIYGSSTVMVYSAGHGVHCFTLDPHIGEFLLCDQNVSTPRTGKYYSVNESNYARWNDGYRRVVRSFKGIDGELDERKNARYIGSLVADFHRNLLAGGVFLYPPDVRSPNGKLRLMYEASPLAFIAEQAGGAATNGEERILTLVPEALHQRTPLVIGSADDVAFVTRTLAAAQVPAA